MSYWWINTDHWFFLRKLWRKQYINVNCQVVYAEWQPVFHIFLYFSYTGVGAPQGLDQALLLLLEAGEAAGGPRCGGGGALGQGEEPAHPPRVPGPEARVGPACLSQRLRPVVASTTETGAGRTPGTRALGGHDSSKRARPGVPGSSGACSGGGCRTEGTRVPGPAPYLQGPAPNQPDSLAAQPSPPPASALRAPPPLRAASSAGAAARTYTTRRRSSVRRSSGSPSPLAGRAVSMGHPLPPPPLPPPPPPLGAVSMARRRRRSASSVTQVHK